MTILPSLCITLLSLFFTPVHVASAHTLNHTSTNETEVPTIGNNRFEKGPGPQKYVSSTAPAQTKLRKYYWTLDLDLNAAKHGIKVYPWPNHSAVPEYIILPDRATDKGFIIQPTTNVTSFTSFAASDTAKAPCNYRHTYHAYDSGNTTILYTIHPRGPKTDRWYMHITGADGITTKFTYFRSSEYDMGTVRFTEGGNPAAYFDFFDYPTEEVGFTLTNALLIVDPSVKIDAGYFIGLWNIVNSRMYRCGV